MSENGNKSCLRCHASFECRVDAIHLCQCSAVELDDKERNYINEQFDDCLCARCLKEMKEEYRHKQGDDLLNPGVQ